MLRKGTLELFECCTIALHYKVCQPYQVQVGLCDPYFSCGLLNSVGHEEFQHSGCQRCVVMLHCIVLSHGMGAMRKLSTISSRTFCLTADLVGPAS